MARLGVCQICQARGGTDWSIIPACGHPYHSKCITTWHNHQRSQQQPTSCPVCRVATATVFRETKSERTRRNKQQTLSLVAIFGLSECIDPSSSSPVRHSSDSSIKSLREDKGKEKATDEHDEEEEDDDDYAPARPAPDRELLQTIRDLRHRLSHAENTLVPLQALPAVVETLTTERDDLALLVNRLEGDMEEQRVRLDAEILELQNGQPDLKRQLREKEVEVDQLREEWMVERESAEERTRTAMEKLSKEKKERTVERGEMEKLKGENLRLRKKLDGVGLEQQAQIDRLKGKLQDLQSTNETLSNQHEMVLLSKENEMDTMKKKHAELTLQLGTTKQDLAKAKKENSTLRSSLGSWENKCAKLETRLQTQTTKKGVIPDSPLLLSPVKPPSQRRGFGSPIKASASVLLSPSKGKCKKRAYDSDEEDTDDDIGWGKRPFWDRNGVDDLGVGTSTSSLLVSKPAAAPPRKTPSFAGQPSTLPTTITISSSSSNDSEGDEFPPAPPPGQSHRYRSQSQIQAAIDFYADEEGEESLEILSHPLSLPSETQTQPFKKSTSLKQDKYLPNLDGRGKIKLKGGGIVDTGPRKKIRSTVKR
ncbi:hypothetical protein T439DRAFT_327017 [Meredithblackwellia eburnea MCA 4105]